jgi:ferric-dicitrate binding protein FerR (iron transport regulator)
MAVHCGWDDELGRRSVLRLAVLPIALLIARVAQAENQQKAGEVEDVKGEAFAEKDSVRRDLNREAPLYIRDQVATGAASRLAMRLARDTIIRLGERARLVIDRYLVDAGGEINLESGPMLLERSLGELPPLLQIRSPFALIAVRGTRFFAGPSNGVFGVFVDRGSVAVSAAGQQVVLRAGERTNVRWPGAAPTRPAQWREARIRAALASVT